MILPVTSPLGLLEAPAIPPLGVASRPAISAQPGSGVPFTEVLAAVERETQSASKALSAVAATAGSAEASVRGGAHGCCAAAKR